jgi:hypothetical protein
MYGLAYIIGMIIPAGIFGLLASALMRLVAKKITGFRPTWPKAYATNTGGFFINHVIGLAVGKFLVVKTSVHFFQTLGIQSAISLAVYVGLHLVFDRNRDNERPTPLQALGLAAMQLGVGIACVTVTWFVFSALRK